MARIHQPIGVSVRPNVHAGPSQGHGERARLPDRVGRRASDHHQSGDSQLHGVAGRGVLRGVHRPAATGPTTSVARGAVRPARQRAEMGRVCGRNRFRPVSGRGQHVRVAILPQEREKCGR